MFVTLKQAAREEKIVINSDQIISIRKKTDGNYHVALPGFGIDISEKDYKNLRFCLFKPGDIAWGEGDI